MSSLSTARISVGFVCFVILAIPLVSPSLEPAVRRADKSNESLEPPKTKPKADPGAVEVRFVDGSTMKMSLREEKIEFLSAYGKLMVPMTEIKKIEFAMRIPTEINARINSAISALGSNQYKVRQAASEELFLHKEKSVPALTKALQSIDMEVMNRAEEILKRIRAEVAEELLEYRVEDLIVAGDSRIVGKIEVTTLKVNTFQFGEQPLKLADVRSIRSLAIPDDEKPSGNIEPAPQNMVNLQGQIGKTFVFRVTGADNGSLWGTDVYTTDSHVATAAVHCGLVKVGQTGVIKVTVVPSPPAFIASMRNGVASSPYQQYPAAYRVHK